MIFPIPKEGRGFGTALTAVRAEMASKPTQRRRIGSR